MTDWEARTREIARAVGIDENYFANQIRQESGFNPNAFNPSGATGIAQIIPRFHPGVDPTDPEASLQYAARLMKDYLAAYGSWKRALIAYNWGSGNLARWDGQDGSLPAETRRYIATILGTTAGTGMKLSEVLARARSRTGDPYVWGGKMPPSTDCSGFVSWAYNGQVPSFTDAILDATQRVETPAPGDIVLYQYADAEQPGVTFPHVALYLDDATVLDNRFGLGVGVHPQLSRARAQRFYRRVPGVVVDTVGTPPSSGDVGGNPDPCAQQLAGAMTLVGEAYNYDGTVRKTLAGLKQQIADLERFLEASATKKQAA